MLPVRNPSAAPNRLYFNINVHTRATVTDAPTELTRKIALGRSMLASALEAGVPTACASRASASTPVVLP